MVLITRVVGDLVRVGVALLVLLLLLLDALMHLRELATTWASLTVHILAQVLVLLFQNRRQRGLLMDISWITEVDVTAIGLLLEEL